MNEQEKVFNDYIDKYKELTLFEKREEIINKFKELIAVSQKVSIDLGDNSELLLNRELLDLNKEEVNEEDYLEAIFVYLNTLEDLIGKSFNKLYEGKE